VSTDCRRQAMEHVLRSVQATIAAVADADVFVHAGVVGWNNRAIVLPGRSFSGKTTLVAAFLRQGATYYSDEYAVFDSSGRVHPYARPLHVRERNAVAGSLYPPQRFGAVAGTQPLAVALVVLARYAPHTGWLIHRLSPGNTLLKLIANTVGARSRSRQTIQWLRHVALNARAYEVRRGESDDAVKRLLEVLNSDVLITKTTGVQWI
jgi:hypothetical protein